MNEDGSTPHKRHRIGGNFDNSTDTHSEKDNGISPKTIITEDQPVVIDTTKVTMLQIKMQEMRQSLVNDLDNRLNDMMSELMHRLRVNTTTQNGFHKDILDNRKRPSNGRLVEKQFVPRNSYLTDLFKINHIRTIYNIFIVMLLILFLNTAVQDYIETGSTHLGIRTIRTGFGNFTVALQIWILMTFSTFLTYVGFSSWSHKRVKYTPKSLWVKILDYGYLLAFIIQQAVFIVLPAKAVIDQHLPPATSLMILMEQVRMVMKTHAFVRSTTPRVLSHKIKDENNQTISSCPGFSKYLYFLFAPTLVYRDEYPRTKQINWKIVLWNFAEVVMVVFYVAFIFERFVIPSFDKYGSDIFKPQIVILTIFRTMLPGLIMFLFGFYTILHSWQNGMAELLRFADKLFYKDWWNCTSYDVYYRTWNIIVHDWLYTYIYKDVYKKFQNKMLATLTVFLVSAIFHEYILMVSFRFFYPVMLIMFGGFGLLFVFISKEKSKMNGNIFIWFTLFLGNGIIFSLYSMEYYARSTCLPHNDAILDLFLPRSWACISSNI